MSPNTGNGDRNERLFKLAKLHADGALTDEEFKALKTKIIAGVGITNMSERRGSFLG